MATFASFLSCSPLYLSSSLAPRLSPSLSICFPRLRFIKFSTESRTVKTLGFASSSSSPDGFNSGNDNSRSKKSVLSNLIQEIEPLDVNLIQRDVPPTTVDAMKRTISGMLGLLPSDHFQVLIEALWKPV